MPQEIKMSNAVAKVTIYSPRVGASGYRVVVERCGAVEWEFATAREDDARKTLKRAGYPSSRKAVPLSQV